MKSLNVLSKKTHGFKITLAKPHHSYVTELENGLYRGVIKDICEVDGCKFSTIIVNIPNMSVDFKTYFFHESPNCPVVNAISKYLNKCEFYANEATGLDVKFEVRNKESRNGRMYCNIVSMTVINPKSNTNLLSEDDHDEDDDFDFDLDE